MTVKEIYDQTIKPLPVAERLQLATLILSEIPPCSAVDHDDDWSAEDMREATLHSLRRAAASFGEEEDDAPTRARSGPVPQANGSLVRLALTLYDII